MNFGIIFLDEKNLREEGGILLSPALQQTKTIISINLGLLGFYKRVDECNLLNGGATAIFMSLVKNNSVIELSMSNIF